MFREKTDLTWWKRPLRSRSAALYILIIPAMGQNINHFFAAKTVFLANVPEGRSAWAEEVRNSTRS